MSDTVKDSGVCPRDGGFTILELIVVMGLLSSFLLMLVQLLGAGVEMYGKGQRGQDLADRAMIATDAITDVLDGMIGPKSTEYDPGPPTTRLLVSWADLGFLAPDGQPHTRTQVVRATVALSEIEEERLLREIMRQPAAENVGMDPIALEEEIDRMVALEPRAGRGDLLLFAWPRDEAGVFLELRRGLFSARKDLDLDIMAIEHFGGDDSRVDTFSKDMVSVLTKPIATGLLHFEVAMWSQNTSSWRATSGAGPEFAWDSARAGRLSGFGEGTPAHETFSLDLGPGSYDDLRDDVFPRYMRVTFVVARSSRDAPDAFLTASVDDQDKTLQLTTTDRLPLAADSRFVKVGAEWVEYGESGRDTLRGVKRGQRNTLALDHPAGTPVRAGKTIVLEFELAHGRDGVLVGESAGR